MANLITTDPLILDSTGTIAFTRPLLVKRVEWYVPTTIGHQAIIADLGGNVILEGTCEVASQSQILWSGPQKLTLPGKSGNANGSWQVVSIQSGKLLVWY